MNDLDTRYNHLQELKELWVDGISVLDNIKPQYRSKADEILKNSLTAAVELITKQIDRLVDYDNRGYYIRKMVDDAHDTVLSKKDGYYHTEG